MDLHNIVFPAPSNSFTINDFREEIIFIPRNVEARYSKKLRMKDSPKNYIPCLLLQTSNEYVSKNICIYFHGNAEDIFIARDLADKIRFCHDINILIVEYPGYSLYYDDKNSDTVLENSLIVFDFLVEEMGISPENILVIGRSIGTAPASYLSSKRNPEGLILISPFTSIRSIAEKLVGGVFKFLISERFENINYVKNITCPILFIHGQEDDLIPYEHTLQLKDECMCPYEVILPENMTHNDFNLDDDFLVPIKNFIKRFTRIKTNSFYSLNYKLLPQTFYLIPDCIEEILRKHEIINNGSFLSNCCTNNNTDS